MSCLKRWADLVRVRECSIPDGYKSKVGGGANPLITPGLDSHSLWNKQMLRSPKKVLTFFLGIPEFPSAH